MILMPPCHFSWLAIRHFSELDYFRSIQQLLTARFSELVATDFRPQRFSGPGTVETDCLHVSCVSNRGELSRNGFPSPGAYEHPIDSPRMSIADISNLEAVTVARKNSVDGVTEDISEFPGLRLFDENSDSFL